MKFSTTSLLVSATLLSSTSQAFNLLDVPQQVIGFVDRTIAFSFGRTPVTPLLQEVANDAGINPLSLPDTIRKYWADIEDIVDEKARNYKFWPLVANHLSPTKTKASFKLKKKPIKKQDKWDMHIKSHPKFPEHALRSKKTPESVGLDTVKQYTGYLDVNKEGEDGKHLFYWFFESRNDPKNDPVVLWLNGGPGCSSLMGMLYELGPSKILSKGKVEFNPYAWNNNASVIFLDQPVGVGFSYADSGEATVTNTRASASDAYAFLSLFFLQFPEYKDLGLHISGESYAGHYIPAIATEIMKHPEREFKFSSVLIGNGWTDTYHQVAGYGPMACGEGGYKSVLTDEQCAKFNSSVARCQWLDGQCYKHADRFRCIPATYTCDSILDPYIKTGLNPYDIRKPCVGASDLCYDDMDGYLDFLNDPKVQEAIGAEVVTYEGCSDAVFNAFTYTGDGGKPFQYDVADLLEKKLPVMIYAGDKDYICNWVGQIKWLDALEWSGSKAWETGTFKSWGLSANNKAGEYKTAENLVFVRVGEAGHMVPYDQPENALLMLNRWIHDDKFAE